MNTVEDTISTLLPDSQNLIRVVLKASEELFDQHHQLTAVIFAVNEDSHCDVIDVPEMSDEAKPGIWAALRNIRRSHPIVAFISEVWMSQCKKEDFNPNGSVKVMPRNDPKRIEKVLIQLWQGERLISFACDIHRKLDKLGDWEIMHDTDFPTKNGEKVEGAMVEGESYPLQSN